MSTGRRVGGSNAEPPDAVPRRMQADAHEIRPRRCHRSSTDSVCLPFVLRTRAICKRSGRRRHDDARSQAPGVIIYERTRSRPERPRVVITPSDDVSDDVRCPPRSAQPAVADKACRFLGAQTGDQKLLQAKTCRCPLYLRCLFTDRLPAPWWLMRMSMLSLTVPLLALLAGSGASMPSSAAPPTPLAPPCTEEMLKASQARDKSLPIACRNAALGEGKELDLIGAHLSYGEIKNAKFVTN